LETQESASFLKKKQKISDSRGICHGQRQTLQGIKVFLLLFVHKKKCFLSFPNSLLEKQPEPGLSVPGRRGASCPLVPDL
jgi:hypothetical protein